MKPLEHRRWFVLLSLALATALMVAMWTASALVLTWHTAYLFLFAVLGLWQGLSRLLALALIRVRPGMGAIG